MRRPVWRGIAAWPPTHGFSTTTWKKSRVRIIIPVKEGAVHTFGEVSVNGNTVFTNEQMIGNWPMKKGETIRRKPIQTRLDAFDELYRVRGYIYAYINPEYVERDNNVVDVHIRNVRAKIDRPFGRASLQTVRGSGYRLHDETLD